MAKSEPTPVEPETPVEVVKCDNHPDRDAKTYTGGNFYRVNLCPECTPPWFKDEEAAL